MLHKTVNFPTLLDSAAFLEKVFLMNEIVLLFIFFEYLQQDIVQQHF